MPFEVAQKQGVADIIDIKRKELIGKDRNEAIDLNLPMYLDKNGCTRQLHNGQLVKGTKPANPLGKKPMTSVEIYLRKQIGWEGKEVFKELLKVVQYDMKKKRHVKPHVTTHEKIEAMKLLLGYAFGKPKQIIDMDATVKSMNLNVSIGMPDDVTLEDIN
jgi:hypothetical protein